MVTWYSVLAFLLSDAMVCLASTWIGDPIWMATAFKTWQRTVSLGNDSCRQDTFFQPNRIIAIFLISPLTCFRGEIRKLIYVIPFSSGAMISCYLDSAG